MSNQSKESQLETLEEDEFMVDLENEVEEEEHEEEVTKDEAKSEEEYDLPEKFRGKSVREVVESYLNLEREFGRKNNEVGQQRKLIDQLLDLERPKKEEAVEEETLDADSLLDNPAEAINKAIANNPTLKAIQEKLVSDDRAVAQKGFEQAHPDWKEVMGSQEFAKWVLASEVRKKMFTEADANYDYATGAALLDDFKSLHPASKEETNEEDTSVEDAARAVTTERKSKQRPSSKKIYSRAQIVELAVNNPAEYERRQEEFRKAYEEGRVRR